ncbi:MAG: hypothetical protein AAB594_03250 [Patescibacteria group bacterium]
MPQKVLLQELSSPGCQHCLEFEKFWRSNELFSTGRFSKDKLLAKLKELSGQ